MPQTQNFSHQVYGQMLTKLFSQYSLKERPERLYRGSHPWLACSQHKFEPLCMFPQLLPLENPVQRARNSPWVLLGVAQPDFTLLSQEKLLLELLELWNNNSLLRNLNHILQTQNQRDEAFWNDLLLISTPLYTVHSSQITLQDNNVFLRGWLSARINHSNLMGKLKTENSNYFIHLCHKWKHPLEEKPILSRTKLIPVKDLIWREVTFTEDV